MIFRTTVIKVAGVIVTLALAIGVMTALAAPVECYSDSAVALSNDFLVESTEPEVEETIYIEAVDYNQIGKSKLEARIVSLEKLAEATADWDTLTDVHNQAIKEKEIAQFHYKNGTYYNPYTEEDFMLLSYMIMIEAGDNITTDEEQCLVASVIINRRNQGGINKNKENPTIKDIINEPGQYAIASKKEINLNTINMSIVTERCKENARKVLEGEFTCPENVVFQATFKQGAVYKSFYHGAPYNNTTYFCYGK